MGGDAQIQYSLDRIERHGFPTQNTNTRPTEQNMSPTTEPLNRAITPCRPARSSHDLACKRTSCPTSAPPALQSGDCTTSL
jgi:hypothetical protein